MMRFTKYAPLLVVAGLAALAVPTNAVASQASFQFVATHASPANHHGSDSHAHPADTACFVQPDNGRNMALMSAVIGAPYQAQTTIAADDFRLTNACTVKSLSAPGETQDGIQGGVYFNITFYQDGGGQPGAVYKTYSTLLPNSAGIITLPAGQGASFTANTTYWMSVQAFSKTGARRWMWFTANPHLNPAVWANTGGWMGQTCSTWHPTITCTGYTEDFAFTLYTSGGGGPIG